ncbi:cortical protein marker for cell polarity-domain-containing protein [Scheffersomyces xylosifermentans]|uniref:cortical protein marker for cell polarity-domain-containing protein n=1 Tax=Scheffersomyces xylosifermentans TaxID=1304137 RepID=UPI00315D8C80
MAPRSISALVSLLYLHQSLAASFQTVTPPELKFSEFGDRLGVFGSFNALSFYSFVNESSFLSAPSDTTTSSTSENGNNSNNLFLRDIVDNNSVQFANVDGPINQIVPISNDTVLINGDFTTFNNKSITSPIIYNVTSSEITNIIPSIPNNSTNNNKKKRADIPTFSSGSVKTVYVDGDLIYLGGDFEFNGTYGAAIYNQTSKELSSTPFQGFGKGSTVNAITKVFDTNNKDEGDELSYGSIIFGGNFNTLGLSELLVHNISTNVSRPVNHTNHTNVSFISAEQQISLRHGIFTSVNAAPGADGSDIICPTNEDTWSLEPQQGGQWLVELPDEMKNVKPTKARLYIPPGEDGTKLFRIYSYPNSGIMNLSYIDPETNQITFCDAWCPLTTLDVLSDAVTSNRKNATELADKFTFVDPENGSFAKYFDPSDMTKTLGYGADYQEFSFVDQVGIDQIGVTIIDWYGNKGVLGGFELYSNAITVYGNDTLNEPNCDVDEGNNLAQINSGDFQSIRDFNPAVLDTNYLVAKGTEAKITLYPNISYSGNYSIIMTTPGCTYDNSCDQRSILNVSVIDSGDNILESNVIWQNNYFDKFDYLFYGHMNGSSTDGGQNRIEISFLQSIIEGTQDPWTVVDKITANIVSLDKPYNFNTTNSTSKNYTLGSELTYIKLNGLFEYSLANFTNFNASKVSYNSTDNKTELISRENLFVGNSTINLLSGQLAEGSVINQFTLNNSSDPETLLLLGSFQSDSKNLTLSNSNLLTLTLKSYNNTSNKTEIGSIEKRDRYLHKRADESKIFGATFNDSVTSLVDFNGGIFLLGQFGLSSGGNSSIKLHDLSNKNASTSSINNFAFFSQQEWYGFGNSFLEYNFDSFTNVTISDIEYYVFAASSSNIFKTWDNTHLQWVNDTDHQLNITHALNLNARQQILGGESFNVMDLYNNDQAYIQNNANFSKFNIDVPTNPQYDITNSYYVNKSLSVVGGTFSSSNVKNIGFIDNSSPDKEIRPLQGNIEWGNSTVINSLYVDSSSEFLFIGVNGSVAVNNGVNITGVVIYDLKNNTFTDFQPAALSNANGDPISVNSIVMYGKSSKLLVGGDFDKAGSLDCVGLCVYDIANTRWTTPQGEGVTTSIDGSATDIKFYQSNEVLVSGNLTLNGKGVNFITYDFDKGTFSTKDSLNSLGTSKVIKKFIVNDKSNKDLSARLVAFGDDFVSGYDGSNWHSIDEQISFDNDTSLNDIKLLDLAKSNAANNKSLFDAGQILSLAGTFSLKEYGLVNLALFNGTQWIPYVYTSTKENKIGSVKSMLIDDSYRFSSSDDISVTKNLSKGKVVGISLACALGSTTLMGLLYIIPYFALFRRQRDEDEMQGQRLREEDMMKTVNPADLLHEIDIQRNT